MADSGSSPPYEFSGSHVSRKLIQYAPFFLFFLTIAAYLPALRNQFVYDDHFQLERNPYIRDFQHIGVLLTTDVWHFSPDTRSNNYRPLHMISYLLLYKWFGLSSFAFHAAALLLYGLSVLLLWSILKQQAEPLLAFAGSLLWALHPVHVETVAWVGGFPDLLCGLFLLSSFLLWTRNRIVLSLLLFLFALFSKETAFIFPLLLVAHHVLFRKHPNKTLILWLCGAGFVMGVYVLLRMNALGSFFRAGAGAGEFFSVFFSAVIFAGMYFEKLLFPIELNAFYHFKLPMSMNVAWPGLLLVLCVLVLAYVYRRNRYFAFGALWCFILLVPALFLTDVSPVLFAERYLYLPSAGFVIALLSFTSRRSYSYALIVVSLVFGILTMDRTRVWRDDLTLWRDTVEKSPDSGTVNYNLGTAYLKNKDYLRAAESYRRVIHLDPGMAESYYNLALCEYNTGNKTQAAENLKKFLMHASPGHPMRKEAQRKIQELESMKPPSRSH